MYVWSYQGKTDEWLVCLVVCLQSKQHLKVVVMDNDLVNSDIVGGGLVDLMKLEVLSDPKKPVTITIPLFAPDDGTLHFILFYVQSRTFISSLFTIIMKQQFTYNI